VKLVKITQERQVKKVESMQGLRGTYCRSKLFKIVTGCPTESRQWHWKWGFYWGLF